MIRRLIAAGFAALSLVSCAEKEEPLNFSILSAESQKSLGPLWAPVIEDLSKAIGRPVKPFFATNYGALVEAMRFNQIQMGWFSALPALQAVRRSNGEVVARFVDPEGRDSYKAVLIVKTGSGITLDQVLKCDRTLTFGIGDAQSTSGTLAPMSYLFIPRGVDPSACFKTVRSASHQTNVWSISKGVLDVATNNSVGLVFAKRENADIRANVETIWESPPLPESSIVVRKDLDPVLRAKIATFFTTYGKAPGPEGDRQRKNLKALESSGFNPADNSYLEPVAAMLAGKDLADAQRGGDPAKIAAARQALETLVPNPGQPAPRP